MDCFSVLNPSCIPGWTLLGCDIVSFLYILEFYFLIYCWELLYTCFWERLVCSFPVFLSGFGIKVMLPLLSELESVLHLLFGRNCIELVLFLPSVFSIETIWAWKFHYLVSSSEVPFFCKFRTIQIAYFFLEWVSVVCIF